jgi:hypothetical protein
MTMVTVVLCYFAKAPKNCAYTSTQALRETSLCQFETDAEIQPHSSCPILPRREAVNLFSFSLSPVAKPSACKKLLPDRRHQQTTIRGPHAVQIS